MSFSDFLEGLVGALQEGGRSGASAIATGGKPMRAEHAKSWIDLDPADPKPMRARQVKHADSYLTKRGSTSGPFRDAAFDQLPQRPGMVNMRGGDGPMLGYWDGHQMRIVTDGTKLGQAAFDSDSYHDPIQLTGRATGPVFDLGEFMKFKRGY